MNGGRQNVNFSNKNIQNVLQNLKRDIQNKKNAQIAINYLKKFKSGSANKMFMSNQPDDIHKTQAME